MRVCSGLASRGIDFVGAPYEAEAQLTLLVEHGHCAAAVSEDSDLVAYGCPRTLSKLSPEGAAQLVSLAAVQEAQAQGNARLSQAQALWAGEQSED